MVIFICEARGAKDLHTAKGARSLTHLNAPMISLWVRTGSLDWPREGNKGARRGAVQKLFVRRSPKAAMVVLLRGASAALSALSGTAQPVDSDDFGETIARFPAAGASSSQSGGAQSIFSLHRRTLMARSQRRAGDHCGRRTTSSN